LVNFNPLVFTGGFFNFKKMILITKVFLLLLLINTSVLAQTVRPDTLNKDFVTSEIQLEKTVIKNNKLKKTVLSVLLFIAANCILPKNSK